jgi:hypothetical protein
MTNRKSNSLKAGVENNHQVMNDEVKAVIALCPTKERPIT